MTIPPSASPSLSLRPYLGSFALIYAVCCAVLGGLAYAFEIKGGGGANVGALMASVIWPLNRFVRDHRRVMTSGERIGFALKGTAITLLVSLALVGAIMLALLGPAEFRALAAYVMGFVAENVGLAAIVVAITTLISFAVIYFASGWAGRMALRQLPAESPATGQLHRGL